MKKKVLGGSIIIAFIVAICISYWNDNGVTDYTLAILDWKGLELIPGASEICESEDNNLDSWCGNYKYVETFGHATNETFNYFIAYEINIFKEGEKYYANIISTGWQIQSESLAEVKWNDGAIEFFFLKTMPNDSLYKVCERYDEQTSLLTFFMRI